MENHHLPLQIPSKWLIFQSAMLVYRSVPSPKQKRISKRAFRLPTSCEIEGENGDSTGQHLTEASVFWRKLPSALQRNHCKTWNGTELKVGVTSLNCWLSFDLFFLFVCVCFLFFDVGEIDVALVFLKLLVLFGWVQVVGFWTTPTGCSHKFCSNS